MLGERVVKSHDICEGSEYWINHNGIATRFRAIRSVSELHDQWLCENHDDGYIVFKANLFLRPAELEPPEQLESR